MPPKNMITISYERYEELQAAERFLEALEFCGVDNWEGYEAAKDIDMENVNFDE